MGVWRVCGFMEGWRGHGEGRRGGGAGKTGRRGRQGVGERGRETAFKHRCMCKCGCATDGVVGCWLLFVEGCVESWMIIVGCWMLDVGCFGC